MRLRILEEWVKYSEAMMLNEVSEIQRKEMCRSFYFGVGVGLHMFMSIADIEDESVAEKVMADITAEYWAFVTLASKVMEGW